jgi:hypothetical protein
VYTLFVRGVGGKVRGCLLALIVFHVCSCLKRVCARNAVLVLYQVDVEST